MSTLEVNKITPVSGGTTVQVGESGDTINIPAGATIANAGTSTGFGDSLRPNVNPLIINGDMAVAQRSTSETGVTTEGYKTCDRFKLNGTVSGAQLTIIQEALTSGEAFNNGFKTAWRADCTTATAPASGERLELQYRMEAQDCSLFKSGTSNAQKFTLAFWVKSSYTGAAQANLYNADSSPNRVCGATYTISSANTWEHKVLNFAADTSNGFNNDNGWGLGIYFMLAAGSDYTSGSVPTAWESYSNADFAAGGTPALSSNTANDWAITGIQLEVGEYTSSTLPPFQHESFGDNLLRCQRYYTKVTRGATDVSLCVGRWYNSNNTGGMFHLPTSMRSNPTLDIATGTNYYNASGSAANNYFDDFTFNDAAPLELGWYKSGLSGTQGDGMVFMTGNANASVAFSSEL